MTQKSYHHGNLRETLIEAGIALIAAEGLGSFSLRKVAAFCGVSHAAPYNHFKDKDSLLEAIKEYVTAKFSAVLEDTIQRHSADPDLLLQLGKTYVRFFVKNPNYLPFLITRSEPCIRFDADRVYSDYRPFRLFQTIAEEKMASLDLPPESYRNTLIALWAIVHGLAAIATSNGVDYEGDWSELVESILRENIRP